MLGITFSPQNYHHHQQFLSKLRENNENDMTSVVWAVIVFGQRVWLLSACRYYVLHGLYPFFLETFGVILKFKGFHCLKVWEGLLLVVVLLDKGIYFSIRSALT